MSISKTFMECPELYKVRAAAARAHHPQQYGDEPYTVHLDDVVAVLGRFGVKASAILMAGYLHDTLEDTALTKDQLATQFGQRVADLVYAVTDGRGATRKIRKERPFRLIPKTPGALVLKLADRIANIESCKRSGHKKLLKMYRKEQAVFFVRLYDPTLKVMFDHIEALLQ